MLIEATSGLLFLVVYLRYGLGLDFVVLCAAVSLLLVLALIDIEQGLILNRIVYPSIVALFVLAPFWGELGLSRSFLDDDGLLGSFLNSILAGFGAFGLFLAITLAYPQGMGGGDVKLAGLVGLLVGFPGVLVSLWITIVSGGLVAVLLLLLRKKGRKDAIPFGPFLALGAMIVLLAGTETASNLVGL